MQTWEITIITDRHREAITAEADAITLQQHQDFTEVVAIQPDENEPDPTTPERAEIERPASRGLRMSDPVVGSTKA